MIDTHSLMSNPHALGSIHSIIHTKITTGSGIAYGLIGLGAGCAMSAAIGTGAGQGIAAGRAAEAVGRNPEAESRIRNMMIIGDGIAESSAIYGLIIAILLLFVY